MAPAEFIAQVAPHFDAVAAADRFAVVACERAALADAINAGGPILLVYGCACGTELTPATQALFESVHAPILLIRA